MPKILIVDLSGTAGGDRQVELCPEVVESTNGELAAYRFNTETGNYEIGNQPNEDGTDFVWEQVTELPKADTVESTS